MRREREYYGNGVFVSAVTPDSVEREERTRRNYDEQRAAVYADWVWKNRPWPRKQMMQEARMTRFLNWKRKQYQVRREVAYWHAAKVAAAFLFGTPVVVTAVSLLWKLALWATL